MQCAEVQSRIEAAFEKRGLPLSQSDAPADEKKVVGLQCGNGLEPPPDYGPQCRYVSQSKKLFVWEFEKAMGRNAWLMPLSRRFFSLLRESYKFYQKLRERDPPKHNRIQIPRAVREEFKWLANLAGYLRTDLFGTPADYIYASDASLSGWSIVALESANGFINDTGVHETPFETSFLNNDHWKPVRVRA